ncbi:hypothetical protein LH425_10495 [Laribacter hongkongensis]|uniref:hypothetical protein n=1 Tax=Laribacter hongkongensis TaxID=168471 RepID=UPI001EFDA159|nr:hypothetical protein [Laribacter hongkongensis]MCG9065464.1 hypothetical protein [Laribacter hongkongensis]
MQRKKAVVRRGKNLTDDAIEQIVRLLDGWQGKLTWEALIDAIVTRLHCKYTRQALHKHERIRVAYAMRKQTLGKGQQATVQSASGLPADAIVKIARLEAENQRLEAENQRLLEQFVVWAYNAHTRGLDKEFLSQPLPRVNRDQSDLPKLAKKATGKR